MSAYIKCALPNEIHIEIIYEIELSNSLSKSMKIITPVALSRHD